MTRLPIGAAKAHKAVRRAITFGDLPPASGLVCVECGAQATEYDHRNYNRPLDVVAVCHGCNVWRGPGIPGGNPTYAHSYGVGFVVDRSQVRGARFEIVDFGEYEDPLFLSGEVTNE